VCTCYAHVQAHTGSSLEPVLSATGRRFERFCFISSDPRRDLCTPWCGYRWCGPEHNAVRFLPLLVVFPLLSELGAWQRRGAYDSVGAVNSRDSREHSASFFLASCGVGSVGYPQAALTHVLVTSPGAQERFFSSGELQSRTAAPQAKRRSS
jgi:hypothetical protein